MRTSVKSRIRKNYSVELDGMKIKNLVEKPNDPPNEWLGLGVWFIEAYALHYGLFAVEKFGTDDA